LTGRNYNFPVFWSWVSLVLIKRDGERASGRFWDDKTRVVGCVFVKVKIKGSPLDGRKGEEEEYALYNGRGGLLCCIGCDWCDF
jgi:hypothetical protein